MKLGKYLCKTAALLERKSSSFLIQRNYIFAISVKQMNNCQNLHLNPFGIIHTKDWEILST